MEKMFGFWAENDLKPTKEAMEKLREAYENFGWSGTFTSLSNKGVCRCCKHQLSPLDLSKEEFTVLSQTILERVIIGKDLYRKTTPEELASFKNFVERTKPYDVVVDGLNVSHGGGGVSGNNRLMAKQLATVVKYFVDKNQKVLVLGRKHMDRWPKKEIQYIRNNAHIFLANNLSQDDPCLLYATLSSGENTTFISRDLMRQHKHLLQSPQLKRTFKHWQMSHQFLPIHAKSDGIVVRNPLSYLPVAQGDEKSWHIPYDVEALVNPPQSYEPPRTWLCLRRDK